MAVPLALIGSLAAKAIGGAAAGNIAQSGIESAIDTNRRGQTFAESLLERSIDRQAPFIEAGQAALPLTVLAREGGGEFRDRPIFQQREESGLAALLGSIQGDDLSGFAADRFSTGLDVSEEAQNKARLNDLLNIGLGASGQAGQTGQRIAGAATTGALQRGNLGASGAQTSFEQRQNILNQQLEGLSGLPSFFAATAEG